MLDNVENSGLGQNTAPLPEFEVQKEKPTTSEDSTLQELRIMDSKEIFKAPEGWLGFKYSKSGPVKMPVTELPVTEMQIKEPTSVQPTPIESQAAPISAEQPAAATTTTVHESMSSEDETLFGHAPNNPSKAQATSSASKLSGIGGENSAGTGIMKLANLLITKRLITEDQLEVALQEQRDPKNQKKMLGAILVELGFITESTLGEILSESTGIKKVDLNKTALDSTLINKITKEAAKQYRVIALSSTEDSVTVAMNDVYNIVALDQIKKFFPKNMKIIPVYAIESQIMDVIDKYYKYDMSIDGILKEIETGIVDKKFLSGEEQGYVNPTVRLVDALLVDAVKKGASDIHFEPEGSFVRLRLRIDGQLVQTRSFHKEYWQAIAIRIKILSEMNIAEFRHPQDGRISLNVLGREIDFRVATQPTVHGENIVLRILDKKQSLLELSKLGFSHDSVEILKKVLHHPEGIIIVTGPTGSGKTTTLYSVLSYINSIAKNIMTLEDPVEYQLPLIRQSNARAGSGMSFADGIKSLLRQDPDIIFVGEVRDEATATMAIRAALTGHQVFTTLHANDAFGAIPRLMDIGISPTLIADVLVCVMAQRLARLLCVHCKEQILANEKECRILLKDPKNPPTIYKRVGCEACNDTGYKGRIGICEILALDRTMGEMIQLHATTNQMLKYAKDNGYITMLDDGVEKVLKGFMDIPELIRTIDVTDRL